MTSEEKIVLSNAKGVCLRLFFLEYQGYLGDIYQDPTIKEKFLNFLYELLESGDLVFVSDGKRMEGTHQEQIDEFRKYWPAEYDEKIPEKDINCLWWWTEAPAGALWIYPDGTEEWT